MSSTLHTTSTSPNFEANFEAALAEFTKRTGQDLCDHPIATKIDRCTSPDAILDYSKSNPGHLMSSGIATID
jgi:hypothetical protein